MGPLGWGRSGGAARMAPLGWCRSGGAARVAGHQDEQPAPRTARLGAHRAHCSSCSLYLSRDSLAPPLLLVRSEGLPRKTRTGGCGTGRGPAPPPPRGCQPTRCLHPGLASRRKGLGSPRLSPPPAGRGGSGGSRVTAAAVARLWREVSTRPTGGGSGGGVGVGVGLQGWLSRSRVLRHLPVWRTNTERCPVAKVDGV